MEEVVESKGRVDLAEEMEKRRSGSKIYTNFKRRNGKASFLILDW